MKTLLGILLLANWMFGAAPEKSNSQTANFKEQVAVNGQRSFLREKAPAMQVIYLDANGNVVNPK